MESQNKWTSFSKRIHIQATMDQVYRAWACSSGIESWFLEQATYWDSSKQKRKGEELVQRGDSFNWKWHNWDFEEKGEILEANGKDRISFTFGAGGNVHIHLKESQWGVEVELTQDHIPTDEESKLNIFVGCSTGWTFWLTNLKAWLEYGITLHIKGLPQSETQNLVNS
ncbi:MAG: SRPBCC domain-containing protein, partial [Cyclobacteriaceae bacterium]|uniref:SRPBCC family protein n=1 Tax=Algoriphagus marincola TaxID=264027 RepID=UPI000688604F|nr:SRPBCC domain-containing protein [Algoriphagus marincola]MCR9081493.1 SRPBCC domain-containing protein [Cyclobacteriaceae bacterium]